MIVRIILVKTEQLVRITLMDSLAHVNLDLKVILVRLMSTSALDSKEPTSDVKMGPLVSTPMDPTPVSVLQTFSVSIVLNSTMTVILHRMKRFVDMEHALINLEFFQGNLGLLVFVIRDGLKIL